MKTETTFIHINDVTPGHTIRHNGKDWTVCARDIKKSAFMGRSIFGDCYRLGTKLVELVTLEKESRE